MLELLLLLRPLLRFGGGGDGLCSTSKGDCVSIPRLRAELLPKNRVH